MSSPLSSKSEHARREEEVLAFWSDKRIFEKSLKKPSPKGEFIFYEGPPTANGKPGIHHLESRAFKDAIPRYKTMRGYRVRRRAGWDTHGLPVELEVEKELGFSGKPDIESYGIAAFNKKCRESVLRYIELWQTFTERIGYWVDQTKAYFTFDASYMESVWSIVKKTSDDGRLYKDYKVLPWCSRCGTALSSHELAQGYENVKDLSVTAKFELVDEPGTYLLAWTTTPWTLPGNVALAVGKNIEYGLYEYNGAKVVAATECAPTLEIGTPLKTFRGEELIGKAYKPLFHFLPSLARESEKVTFEKAYQVYSADFVTTEEGTGIVHTAVMYGQDDFELGTRVGLPKVHAVGADGRFIRGTGFLEGRFVRDEEVAVDIIKDLAGKDLLFSKEKYEHSYPFCWRCKTPLIYYARDSWYIRMTDLRDTLLAENKNIHWEPEHIRDGRMGEWLGNVKDWAVSRERYWGTPLPVWESADGKERLVVDSVPTLKKHTKRSGNQYFIMRHGESENNAKGILNAKRLDEYGLTEKGRAQVKESAETLKGKKITKIFCSPVRRAKESAHLVAKTLGFSEEQIVIDHALREFEFGEFEGKSLATFLAYVAVSIRSYSDRVPGGESYQNAKERFGEFLYRLEKEYSHENILIVGHGIGVESIEAVVGGLGDQESCDALKTCLPKNAEVRHIDFVPIPHNEQYELDLHRPYIDDVVLVSERGTELRRVKEVMDVWFDSGSMPFAQGHYPFENKAWIEGKGYPAYFISEAIDQTRGWFYTLLAIGVLRGRGAPYRNVICLGHLLDKEGKKMSKSKGNVVDPWTEMDRWGADTIRFWMYSVNQSGDSKNYDEKTVKEAARVLSWFSNSATFYETFRKEIKERGTMREIDTWILARTHHVEREVTRAMDAYRPYEATRALATLLEDLSQWYVRRVRDRVREGDAAALRTLREVLRRCALLLAPFTPFLAEEVFQKVKKKADPESVHLALWPYTGEFLPQLLNKRKLLNDMVQVRTVASTLLMERQKAGINVRQPLQSATIPYTLSKTLMQLLKDEVNVKEIIVGKDIALDTTLTPELQAEGSLRELIREIQDARKEAGLVPKDTIRVVVPKGEYPKDFEEDLRRVVNAEQVMIGETLSITKTP